MIYIFFTEISNKLTNIPNFIYGDDEKYYYKYHLFFNAPYTSTIFSFIFLILNFSYLLIFLGGLIKGINLLYISSIPLFIFTFVASKKTNPLIFLKADDIKTIEKRVIIADILKKVENSRINNT